MIYKGYLYNYQIKLDVYSSTTKRNQQYAKFKAELAKENYNKPSNIQKFVQNLVGINSNNNDDELSETES